VNTSAFVSRLAVSLLKNVGIYPFVRPSRTVGFLKAVAEAMVLYDLQTMHQVHSPIPVSQLSDLFPEVTQTQVAISYTPACDGGLPYRELIALCAMVKQTNAKSIFEFGTFQGRTTLFLAMNSDPDARIFTLDLPPQQSHSLVHQADASDLKYLPRPGMSDLGYLNTAVAHKVTQLYGDSALFDCSQYHKQMDFIFIDGAHSYQYTKSDTESAFDMLSGQGIVVWHDYTPVWPGAYRFLQELCRDRGLFHIADTSLVVYAADYGRFSPWSQNCWNRDL